MLCAPPPANGRHAGAPEKSTPLPRGHDPSRRLAPWRSWCARILDATPRAWARPRQPPIHTTGERRGSSVAEPCGHKRSVCVRSDLPRAGVWVPRQHRRCASRRRLRSERGLFRRLFSLPLSDDGPHRRRARPRELRTAGAEPSPVRIAGDCTSCRDLAPSGLARDRRGAVPRRTALDAAGKAGSACASGASFVESTSAASFAAPPPGNTRRSSVLEDRRRGRRSSHLRG